MSLTIGKRGAPVIALQHNSSASRTDGENPAPSAALPSETAKPQRTGIAAVTLGDIWNGIANFLKGTFQAVTRFIGKLFSPSQPQQLDEESAAIAQAYNLLPTKENVQAFLAEAQSYEKEDAIGPGSPADFVKNLQETLKKLGYNLQASGEFDDATCSAVMDFKRRNGIHQSYQMVGGTYAVNEYADKATLAMLQTTPTTPNAPTAQTPTTPTIPAAPTSPTTPNAPATQIVPTPQPLLSGDEAIIKQYNLLPTKENVNAFLAETQAYKSNGTLGPGIEAPADIKEMQTILAMCGYPVKLNGVYDEATAAAVMKFKKDVGIHENYKLADGTFAVNEYAGPDTLTKLLERAEAESKKNQTTSPSTPVQKPSTPAAPSGSASYTVQKGDSLWKIAQNTLGNGNRWKEIYNLNQDKISNPNLITPGLSLKLPDGANSTNSSSAPAQSSSNQLSSLSSAELANLGANDKQAFFAALRPAAEEAEKKYGVPAALTLAQAALESGWGKHSIGGYNIFGIKGSGPAGTISKQTQEWDGSKYITITANFAKYNNFYEAVVEHGKLFHNGYYNKAVNQFAKDHNYKNFVNNIQGIYATSPTYSKSIFSLIDQYGLA